MEVHLGPNLMDRVLPGLASSSTNSSSYRTRSPLQTACHLSTMSSKGLLSLMCQTWLVLVMVIEHYWPIGSWSSCGNSEQITKEEYILCKVMDTSLDTSTNRPLIRGFCFYSRQVILIVSSLCRSRLEIQSLLCEDTWMINVVLLYSAIWFCN